MTVAKDIKAVATYLREKGWTQNTYETRTGECCIRGAEMKELANYNTGDVAYERVEAFDKAIFECLPEGSFDPKYYYPSSAMIDYNDRPDRTKDEVLAMLDDCAERNADK